MNVLYAFLVLIVLGFLLGLLLYFASRFFRVEEDPRIKEVARLLPNYNCGACGEAGCNAMAEAIVNGKVKKLSQCKPGKKDANFEPIIAYLKEHPNQDGTYTIPEI